MRERDGFAFIDRHFALAMPFRRFALNTLVASGISLVPLLLLYVALTPGFGAMLAGGGEPLRRFLRQVVVNGVPIVFAVNYVGFFLYAAMTGRGDAGRMPLLVLLIDPPARIAAFVLLHGAIYAGAAIWFGSFGGDPWQALRVVGPTLAHSAAFANISGVYLYATLASALPLYAAAVATIAAGRGRRRARLIGVAGALGLFAALALGLTALAAGLGRL